MSVMISSSSSTSTSFSDASIEQFLSTTFPMKLLISSKYPISSSVFMDSGLSTISEGSEQVSCFLRCLSRFVCCPKHRSQSGHLNGFSLLCIFLTCLCRLEEIEKDLSQYLHLYGCSPVCVRKCLVRLAERGNTFPQNLQAYLSLDLLWRTSW